MQVRIQREQVKDYLDKIEKFKLSGIDGLHPRDLTEQTQVIYKPLGCLQRSTALCYVALQTHLHCHVPHSPVFSMLQGHGA